MLEKTQTYNPDMWLQFFSCFCLSQAHAHCVWSYFKERVVTSRGENQQFSDGGGMTVIQLPHRQKDNIWLRAFWIIENQSATPDSFVWTVKQTVVFIFLFITLIESLQNTIFLLDTRIVITEIMMFVDDIMIYGENREQVCEWEEGAVRL